MKNILLLIHDDVGQEARFQAALDLTRALKGHLTCLDVSILPAMVGDDYGGAALLLQEERTRESANMRRIRARLAHEDVSWDLLDTTGDLEPCLEEASRMADLIVVNRKLDSFPVPDMRTVTAELVIRCGKPILAVPEEIERLDLAGRALVAWDGSEQATAALQAAVPLLQIAESVTLLEVDDGSIEAPAEEAAAYLSRHGIEANIDRLPRDPDDVGDAILSQARNLKAGYVVLGAFGHSRIREALFGGVTRELLTKSAVPLFLAH